jgi:Outer membrane lipoprotein-sorting protein
VIEVKKETIWMAVILFVLAPVMAPPLNAKPIDGDTLAQHVYDRDIGKDSLARVRMLLIDRRGHKTFRTLVTFRKDYGHHLNKSYTRFTSPADIEGTSFLTWENKGRPDDQFLYLPALKRVRRIVSRQKSNRFVNTDFTYEDFQTRKPDEDTHTILKEETFMGHDCWVLQSVPKVPEDTQYGKRVSWIIKDTYLIIRTDFYDKHNRLIKIFFARRIKKVDDIWTVMESEMRDLRRKHRTYMKTEAIQYNRGIPDRIFTRGYMKNKE